jgi:hypothetical protein
MIRKKIPGRNTRDYIPYPMKNKKVSRTAPGKKEMMYRASFLKSADRVPFDFLRC